MEKILIVDDHPVVLDGLHMLLEDVMQGVAVTTVSCGDSALRHIKKNPDFDWIFMDVKLPDADGIDLLKKIENYKCIANIVVLSSDNSPATVDHAIRQGACGFLSKSFDRTELKLCINSVENGKIYLSEEMKRALINYRESVLIEKQHIESSLTERQHQILIYLSKGYSNREIAQEFEIAENTVKSHVQALMNLFEADNRTHCVSEALRLSIL